jgi:cytochrome P450
MTYAAVRGFEDGDSLHPDRKTPPPARDLHFGAGAYHCIGYALARAELDLSMERLGSVGPLRVARRRVAHNVLIPRYSLVEVETVR